VPEGSSTPLALTEVLPPSEPGGADPSEFPRADLGFPLIDGQQGGAVFLEVVGVV